jgi:hypothetical protein
VGTATRRAVERKWKEIEEMLDAGREIDAMIEARRLVASAEGPRLTFKGSKDVTKWAPVVSRVLKRLTPLLSAAGVTGYETVTQFEAKVRAPRGPAKKKPTALQPGAYVVVIDPEGDIAMPGGLRARVLHEQLDSSDPAIAAALKRAEQERHDAEMKKIADEMQSKREAVSRVLDLIERERRAPGGHGTATLYDLYSDIAAAFTLRAPERQR